MHIDAMSCIFGYLKSSKKASPRTSAQNQADREWIA